jgi:HJR/Mrr/RecB family endonuclease
LEEIVAELLAKDGYEVSIQGGSNDKGADILAEKEIPGVGRMLSVWQAKKTRNRVGIEVIRELADTRNEFKASKGLIVTSSYLTRGALERIERDKYILGGVDRKRLLEWICNYPKMQS